MVRVLKKYSLHYRVLPNSEQRIPGSVITFSGYPGVILSFDDFYITRAKLVITETSLAIANDDLWQYVQPNGTVLESVRIMVANRLADNVDTWSNIFSEFNSGTYNNQWMVIDYKKFKRGKQPKKGLLRVLEQLPGCVVSADQTNHLVRKQYFPSYNIPYYRNIFKLGGYDKLVEKYGDWYSYHHTPRAKIIKRDHKKVTNWHSLFDFMRSNNYKHDKFSECKKCKPPYSAVNAIAARYDLNPANGTYPFKQLGHSPGGAIDSKMVNLSIVEKQQFLAVSGPTRGTKNVLPVFKWSTSDFVDSQPHLGQPNEWNFDPLLTEWLS